MLINHPDLMAIVDAQLTAEDFVTTFNRHIFSVVANRIREGKSITMAAVSQELTAEEHGVLAGLEVMGRTLTQAKRDSKVKSVSCKNPIWKRSATRNSENCLKNKPKVLRKGNV